MAMSMRGDNMPAAAVKGGSVQGTTTEEHHGHYDAFGNPIHVSGTLNGTITPGSSKLRINGVFVALEGESVDESDNCGSGSGSLGSASHKLKVNGVSVQCIGDSTNPHNDSAEISSGNSKIITV